jgi:hypothetical protein
VVSINITTGAAMTMTAQQKQQPHYMGGGGLGNLRFQLIFSHEVENLNIKLSGVLWHLENHGDFKPHFQQFIIVRHERKPTGNLLCSSRQ